MIVYRRPAILTLCLALGLGAAACGKKSPEVTPPPPPMLIDAGRQPAAQRRTSPYGQSAPPRPRAESGSPWPWPVRDHRHPLRSP